MKSIDRYMARLIVVPLISTLIISAMLLVLDRMLRLFDFVATEGGPVSVVWRCNPRNEGGVSEVPGLYFVGLHFLYAFSSAMIHGVGRDADRVSDAVAASVVREGRERLAA